jgi:hypothetical protein
VLASEDLAAPGHRLSTSNLLSDGGPRRLASNSKR